MSFVIEQLGRDHVRDQFDCGESALNEYLSRYARQNDERGLGRTYVAVPANDSRVVGYYTLAAGSVGFASIPDRLRKRFPRYPVPVAHLGRLGVCLSVRGQGLGEALLINALERSIRVSEELGIVTVEVRVKTDSARAFYVRYGFEPLLDDPLHLYLPLITARAALGT